MSVLRPIQPCPVVMYGVHADNVTVHQCYTYSVEMNYTTTDLKLLAPTNYYQYAHFVHVIVCMQINVILDQMIS